MFREMTSIEYVLEILRALHHNTGRYDSITIYNLVQNGGRVRASKSYVQKILSRMIKTGLLQSNEHGYTLAKPIDEITVDQVLDICDMPDQESPLYSFCNGVKQGVSLTAINEFYDFS